MSGETGNACSTIPSGGKDAPPPPDPDCVDLANDNANRREQLGEETSDKTLVGRGEGRGTTVTSSKMSMGSGQTPSPGAHSRNGAHARLNDTFSQGGQMTDRHAGRSGLAHCSPPYEHPKPSVQKSGHAEARLMDQYAPQGLKAVTFSIDWRPTNPLKPASKMPCDTCHAMLCHAQKNCDIQIKLCTSKGQTVDMASHCDGPEAYSNLARAMGEAPPLPVANG